MTDKTLSSLVGGGGLPRLAPDLTYPSSKAATANYKTITGIDASSGLTTALSLTGNFAVSYLAFYDQAAESNRYKLTVDGVVIWDDTKVAAAGVDVFLGDVNISGTLYPSDITIECESSLLLEVHTATDTNIGLYYIARAIV
ncbi:MAG: hypothetical protein GY905_11630 [Gammaproteobacteria bacterium]|nr:hypothetical protein [Gammaproteobacteria bacterium]